MMLVDDNTEKVLSRAGKHVIVHVSIAIGIFVASFSVGGICKYAMWCLSSFEMGIVIGFMIHGILLLRVMEETRFGIGDKDELE